jgi:hypothetical protein
MSFNQKAELAYQAVKIARVCHEANKEYCETIGDHSQPAWEDAPDWQKESAAQGVLFFFDNPLSNPIDMHNNWLEQKRADGWVYGPVKDPVKKEHPCMVEYHELPEEQRRKDDLFIGIVRALMPKELRV